MNGNIRIVNAENNYLPQNISVLSDVIGQSSAIKKLEFFVQAAYCGENIPTLLFNGSHGLGKTFMAKKMADTLNRKFVEVNCGTLQTDDDFFNDFLIPSVMGDRTVTILFDEAHKLSNNITTILLSLLNPNDSGSNFVTYKNWNLQYDFNKINAIFATTDAHKIFKPLLNRMDIVDFHNYTDEDIIKIIDMYCHYEIDMDCGVIANVCQGRARNAYLLSDKINKYMAIKKFALTISNWRSFNDNDWKKLCDVFEIFPNGLSKSHIRLLQVLKDYGPVSLANLAAKCSLNTSNIEVELEPLLNELGYIENTRSGRVITASGEKTLNFMLTNDDCRSRIVA